MQKASDVKDDDSKISEFIPALKPLPETIIVNSTPYTARSIGTESELATLKEDDLPLKPGPEDIPGDDNNGDDEMILHNVHCDDCDTTLYTI